MAHYARVVNGVVAEIFSPPAGMDVTPEDVFGSTVPGTWIECGPEVQPYWTWNETDGFAAPAPPDPAAAPLVAVSHRQFLMWLADNGKTEADADAIIEAITDPVDKDKMWAAWKYPDGTVYRWDDPVVVVLDAGGLFGGKDVQTVWREMALYSRDAMQDMAARLTKRPRAAKRALIEG